MEKLQHRALRTFLGVGKCAPIPAISGDMGWTPAYIRRHCNVIRLWHRIMCMHSNRLPRKIFIWDSVFSLTHRNTWYNDVKHLMENSGLIDLFNNNSTDGLSVKFVVSFAEMMFMEMYKEKWRSEVDNMPKLRTFKLLKSNFEPQPYVTANLSTQQRSVLARLRNGTFPIEIERGRYRGVPADGRFCKVCKNTSVEDEKHFLVQCPLYLIERAHLFRSIQTQFHTDFLMLTDNEKLVYLLTMDSKLISNYIINISKVRNDILSV